jgi:hypothetical protein
MTLTLATTGAAYTGDLGRDRFGLRFVIRRGAYRATFELLHLLASGWSVTDASEAERCALEAAGLWRRMTH